MKSKGKQEAIMVLLGDKADDVELSDEQDLKCPECGCEGPMEDFKVEESDEEDEDE